MIKIHIRASVPVDVRDKLLEVWNAQLENAKQPKMVAEIAGDLLAWAIASRHAFSPMNSAAPMFCALCPAPEVSVIHLTEAEQVKYNELTSALGFHDGQAQAT